MKKNEIIENEVLLIEYFGYLPTFHDDVITDISFNLKQSSMEMKIMSEVKSKKVFVIFSFDKIKKIEMEGFEPNCNIIFEINFTKEEKEVEIEVRPSVGLYAKIICERVMVKDVNEEKS